MATIELYATQLQFLDRVVADGAHGGTRADALRKVLREHVKQRLAGATAFVGGTARHDVLEAPAPTYGEGRLSHVLEPIEGKAVPVRRGEVLRIEQVVGGTCVDFNAFNLHDYKESLDCGFTRSSQSFDPRRGEFIWTNAPRGRQMFAILEIADTCELDITGHRCNRVYQDLGWGLTDHANCQDTLAESIREYGLTPDDVHDSFNMWMATTVDAEGRRQFRWNPGRRGDRIELLAMFDVLAAVAICGSGELVGINNYTYEPVKVEVLEASPDTERLVDRIEERWGRLESQVRTEAMGETPIHAARGLERDPAYVPSYRPAPAIEQVELDLGEEERDLVAGLVDTGLYGATEGEAVRAAFMRWCNANVTLFRKPMLSLTGA
jgi:uncharacterized protein YcgI (DUF1989 family)